MWPLVEQEAHLLRIVRMPSHATPAHLFRAVDLRIEERAIDKGGQPIKTLFRLLLFRASFASISLNKLAIRVSTSLSSTFRSISARYPGACCSCEQYIEEIY
jgi:hypothetical protein